MYFYFAGAICEDGIGCALLAGAVLAYYIVVLAIAAAIVWFGAWAVVQFINRWRKTPISAKTTLLIQKLAVVLIATVVVALWQIPKTSYWQNRLLSNRGKVVTQNTIFLPAGLNRTDTKVYIDHFDVQSPFDFTAVSTIEDSSRKVTLSQRSQENSSSLEFSYQRYLEWKDSDYRKCGEISAKKLAYCFIDFKDDHSWENHYFINIDGNAMEVDFLTPFSEQEKTDLLNGLEPFVIKDLDKVSFYWHDALYMQHTEESKRNGTIRD